MMALPGPCRAGSCTQDRGQGRAIHLGAAEFGFERLVQQFVHTRCLALPRNMMPSEKQMPARTAMPGPPCPDCRKPRAANAPAPFHAGTRDPRPPGAKKLHALVKRSEPGVAAAATGRRADGMRIANRSMFDRFGSVPVDGLPRPADPPLSVAVQQPVMGAARALIEEPR